MAECVRTAGEALWYLDADEKSIQSFIAHADQIAIATPQVFAMDSTGRIRGHVDPRVIETARAKGVKVMRNLLSLGVSPRKISLGLASYSDWWYPPYDKRHGARLRGSDIPYVRGNHLRGYSV